MKAITFENTQFAFANCRGDMHLVFKRGYAYALPTHNVFMFGESAPCCDNSYMEVNVPDMATWCKTKFGAANVQDTFNDVGDTVNSVWRPGLAVPNQLGQALAFSEHSLANASQALRLLVTRLDEILMFIEPTPATLNAFGHKSRDLLIAACTEVENYFQHYMGLASAKPQRGRHFTVHDYVRLQPHLFLDEFGIDMYAYSSVGVFHPFAGWAPSTVILPWYDAYNKTKHHRDTAFDQATLLHCIHAVGACLALYSVRFGPIWWQSNFINSPIPDACRLFRLAPFQSDLNRPGFAGGSESREDRSYDDEEICKIFP